MTLHIDTTTLTPTGHRVGEGSIVIERVPIADATTVPVARRGSSTGRPTIVLLHGITDSWRSFEEVMSLLPAEVHVVAPTLRGHGDADRPDSGYAPDELVSDVIKVLRHMGVSSALVVGHSLGAVVACRLAAARPDLVAGLVLAGGFAAPGQNAAILELVDFAHQISDPIDVDTVAEFQNGTIVRPVADEMMNVFINESLKVPARVWRAAADGLATVDVLDGLTNSPIPTLLTWGTADPFTPSAEQEQLAAALGNATISPYPGTGHAVHWEQPVRFTDELIEWWEGLSDRFGADRT